MEVQPLHRGKSMSEAGTVTAPAPSAPATPAPAVTSTPAPPAPAAATATPAPAAKPETATPTRQLTFREALDAIPTKAEKAAQEAAAAKPAAEAIPAASQPAEAPAPAEAPVETVSEATKAEEPEAPFDPEKYEAKDIEQQRISDALATIQDKEVRDRLKYDRRVAKLVTRPYSEQKEINALFPTTQLARDAVAYREAYDNLSGAYNSGSPEAIRYVVTEMARTNPTSFKALVREIAPHIPKIDQEIAVKSRGEMLDGVISMFRQRAANERDEGRQHEAATVAEILEEEFRDFLPNRAGQSQQRPPQLHPAEQQLQALRQSIMENREQARVNFLDNAEGLVRQTLEKEASALVDKFDRDGLYSEDGKAELRNQILGSILETLEQNPQFQRSMDALSRNGKYDHAHVRQYVETKLQAARSYMEPIALEKAERFAKMFQSRQTKVLQRQEEIASRRDVGASGATPSAPAPSPIDTKGKTLREMLDLIPRRQRA